ncbi:MAG: LacI family DNA-binding transcriptional regulator [Terrimicrobiaceae bacterium]
MESSHPSSRITIRDLAKRLDLSHATISMALRDHPKIAEKTRCRVKEEAERCGYRPEPMLSALATYRQMKKAPIDHGRLAWLYNNLSRAQMFSTPLFRRYFEGACSRANSLGYCVDEFYLDETKMTGSRLSSILQARGIQGILLPPQPRLQLNKRLEMLWDQFSAVTFGFSLFHPQLHMVGSAQYRIGMATTRKLQELGYERIGFLETETFGLRTDNNFLAGFHMASLSVPTSRRIPPLSIPEALPLARISERVRSWITRWRIDALVCVSGIQHILIEAGCRVPEDCAVALLGWQSEFPNMAGMDEQGELIGVAAVNFLVGMIHRGERGVPESPYRLLIEGKWRDGDSAPPAAMRKKGATEPTQMQVATHKSRCTLSAG